MTCPSSPLSGHWQYKHDYTQSCHLYCSLFLWGEGCLKTYIWTPEVGYSPRVWRYYTELYPIIREKSAPQHVHQPTVTHQCFGCHRQMFVHNDLPPTTPAPVMLKYHFAGGCRECGEGGRRESHRTRGF